MALREQIRNFSQLPMMKGQMTVLVLGVGGNVSQGILKALALSSLDCRVVGACTSASAFGLFSVDSARISPPANSESFLNWLLELCLEESVDAILSGVEPVLAVLVLHQVLIRETTGAICVVNAAHAMEIGADKLLTCEWLRNQNLPHPAFAASEDTEAIKLLVQECGFPLIAKPRLGKGSQGILVLRTKAELEGLANMADYVIQEMLGDDESEYTAACLTDRSDHLRGVIVFQRFLTAGTTSCAIAGEFPELREMVAKIAERLKPKGPCNVQLRMHHGRAVCFELNVRFSGTTPIRARLGFNDVEAAIRHYVLGEESIDLPVVRSGQALRYWNEAYVMPQAFEALETTGRLDSPKDFPFSIETYGQKS
jgi:carbamoyl-phosphate synthase large subunit